MRIKPGFELRTICGENILISHGRENINFTKIISLNESAAFVWNKIVGKDFSADDMREALVEEYEVDDQTALVDSQELLKSWREAGLIED